MSETKRKMDVKVGVKYSGYGVLNEFGEWAFIPSQVGSRKGRQKFVCGSDDYTVYTTSKKVIIHMSMERGERLTLMSNFCKIVDNLLMVFRDYDFRRVLSNKDKG